MSQNLEKTAQTITKMVAVVLVSGLAAAGGTWAYENKEWFENRPHPLKWFLTSVLPKDTLDPNTYYKDMVRQSHPEWTSVQQWQFNNSVDNAQYRRKLWTQPVNVRPGFGR